MLSRFTAPTVAGITASLRKMIDDLNQLSAAKATEADELATKLGAAKAEATEAAAIAAKLTKLVS